MNGDEKHEPGDKIRDEVDGVGLHPEAGSGSGERKDFMHYLSRLLMIIGLSLIGWFIASWVQNILIAQRLGGLEFSAEHGNLLLWRILASVVSEGYLYLIVGTILSLLSIHLVGRRSWNKTAPFFILFAGLNAVVLVVGFLGLAFVLDWGALWSPHHSSAFFYITRFLVELTALIAIIVIEIPYLRHGLSRLHIKKKPATEPIEE